MPAKLVQIRRGTTSDHSVFTGKQGEITVDLEKDTVVVHDESTQGGHPLAREDMSNVVGQVGLTQLKLSNINSPTSGQILTVDGNGNILFSNNNADVSSTSIGGDLSGTISDAQIKPNTITVNELNTVEGQPGEVLITDGIGGISFGPMDANPVLGGDLSGTASSAIITQNAVGIIELDVTDGTTGQVLSRNANGNLEFINVTSSVTIGGDLSGPVSSAIIIENAVTDTKLSDDATNDANRAVGTNHIKDLNVTEGKLAADSVTNSKIADGAVDSNKIATSAIDNLKIADNAVDSSKIANNSVNGDKIANNAITASKIANDAVDSSAITNNAVGISELNVSDANAQPGDVLSTNGNGVLAFMAAASGGGSGGFQGIQTFGSVVGTNGEGNGISAPNITTHTWTKPAGVTRIIYFVTGGGGGDGIFSHNGDGTQNNPAQALIRGYGGGGGTVMGFLDVTNIVSETVTVGSCGGNSLGNALNSPGNPSGLTNGSAGEASTFGLHATAFGGGGGLSGVNGGSAVNPNDTTAAAAGNSGGGGGIGGSVQMRGSASRSGPTPGTSFWGETPGGGNGNINRANQGGSGIVVILEF